MLIRTLPTTLLEIFSKVIFQSTIDPDDILKELLSIYGLNTPKRPDSFGHIFFRCSTYGKLFKEKMPTNITFKYFVNVRLIQEILSKVLCANQNQTQFAYTYLVNLRLIPKLFSKVVYVHTTIVKEIFWY